MSTADWWRDAEKRATNNRLRALVLRRAALARRRPETAREAIAVFAEIFTIDDELRQARKTGT